MHTEVLHGAPAQLSISGSAGMGLADACGVPFVQEVFATRVAAKRYAPDADVVIELGGEDAKILFLTGGTEVRMNGSCAGGTGAFIDQMATLLKMTPDEMNEAARHAEKNIYHCQPLRRVCQKRYPAPHQPGRKGRGCGGQHFLCRGEPDHRGPCAGPKDRRQRAVSGRAAHIFAPAEKELRQDAGRDGDLPGKQPLFCGAGRGAVFRRGNWTWRVWWKSCTHTAPRPPMRSTRRCSGTKRNTRRSAHGMQRRACRAVPLRTAPALCISASTRAAPR